MKCLQWVLHSQQPSLWFHFQILFMILLVTTYTLFDLKYPNHEQWVFSMKSSLWAFLQLSTVLHHQFDNPLLFMKINNMKQYSCDDQKTIYFSLSMFQGLCCFSVHLQEQLLHLFPKVSLRSSDNVKTNQSFSLMETHSQDQAVWENGWLQVPHQVSPFLHLQAHSLSNHDESKHIKLSTLFFWLQLMSSSVRVVFADNALARLVTPSLSIPVSVGWLRTQSIVYQLYHLHWDWFNKQESERLLRTVPVRSFSLMALQPPFFKGLPFYLRITLWLIWCFYIANK